MFLRVLAPPSMAQIESSRKPGPKEAGAQISLALLPSPEEVAGTSPKTGQMTSDWAMDVVELSSGDTEIFNTGGQWPPPISTWLGCPGGPSALPDVNPLVAELSEGRRLQGKARAVDSRGLGGK